MDVTFLPYNPNERVLVFTTGCPKTSASQSLSVLGLEWNFVSPLPHREQLLGVLDSPKSVPFAAVGVLRARVQFPQDQGWDLPAQCCAMVTQAVDSVMLYPS